jgi:hypothetical protein
MCQSDVEYAMPLAQGREKSVAATQKVRGTMADVCHCARSDLWAITLHEFRDGNPIGSISHHIRWPYLHNTSHNLTSNEGRLPAAFPRKGAITDCRIRGLHTANRSMVFQAIIHNQQVLLPAEVSSPAFERFQCVVTLNLSVTSDGPSGIAFHFRHCNTSKSRATPQVHPSSIRRADAHPQNNIMSYGHSKCVFEMKEFERRWFSKRRM